MVPFQLLTVVELGPPAVVDEARREAYCVKIQTLARMFFAMKNADEARREASCIKIQTLVRMFFAMKQTITFLSPLVGGCSHDVSVVNQLAVLRRRRVRIVQHAHDILSIAYVRAKRKVEEEKKASIKIQKWFRRRLEIGELMKSLQLYRCLLLHHEATSEPEMPVFQLAFEPEAPVSDASVPEATFEPEVPVPEPEAPVSELTFEPEAPVSDTPVPEATSDPEADATAEFYRKAVIVGFRLITP
jgi:hypothetical protein